MVTATGVTCGASESLCSCCKSTRRSAHEAYLLRIHFESSVSAGWVGSLRLCPKQRQHCLKRLSMKRSDTPNLRGQQSATQVTPHRRSHLQTNRAVSSGRTGVFFYLYDVAHSLALSLQRKIYWLASWRSTQPTACQLISCWKTPGLQWGSDCSYNRPTRSHEELLWGTLSNRVTLICRRCLSTCWRWCVTTWSRRRVRAFNSRLKSVRSKWGISFKSMFIQLVFFPDRNSIQRQRRVGGRK